MKRDSRLSGILHVLLHMAEHQGPVTSDTLAQAMQTNPVVIRRIMAGLRERIGCHRPLMLCHVEQDVEDARKPAVAFHVTFIITIRRG